jgi:hypothetical protein
MTFMQSVDGDASRDDHLPFLTQAQARRLRMLVRHAMAERGREVVVSGGHVQDDQGTVFGLRNIAAICRNDLNGENAWPQLIAGYADMVLAMRPEDTARELAGLTAAKVRDHIYVKVLSADSLGPAIASYRSAPELAPGLLELLALDRPDRSVLLPDDDVARLGGPTWLRQAALANLRALPAPGHVHLDRAGGNLDVIYGESPYTASRLLTLPDLLTQVLGSADAAYGVLAAMPCRHRALFHVLRDNTALPSLRLMARYTRLVHIEEPGPISPHVLWWRDRTWTVLTQDADDGTTTLHINGELAAILRQLATRPA